MSTKLFNRSEKAAVGFIIGVWIISALLSLGLTAAIIWGIIKIVGAVTA